MATRWSLSKALGMTALLAACVSTVTHYYVPDAHNPQFDFAGATATLDRYVRVQCPALVAPQLGVAYATIQVDTRGAVTRAEVTRSTMDKVLDDLFGTVVAQLKVDSLRADGRQTVTRHLAFVYNCAPDAIRADLRIRRP